MPADRDQEPLTNEEFSRLLFTAAALHALIARSLNHNPEFIASTACDIGTKTSERFAATAPGASA